jgi:hypothetical protein
MLASKNITQVYTSAGHSTADNKQLGWCHLIVLTVLCAPAKGQAAATKKAAAEVAQPQAASRASNYSTG